MLIYDARQDTAHRVTKRVRARRRGELTRQQVADRAAALDIDLLADEGKQAAPPPLPAALPDISDDEAPPPLPEREPPASAEKLRELARLYRLVAGRDLSERLAEAAALAPAGAVDDAVKHLDLIRRGLKAYRDLKTRGAGQAEKFRVALTAKLNGLDAKLLESLKPAGFYYAKSTVQLFERKENGDLRKLNSPPRAKVFSP